MVKFFIKPYNKRAESKDDLRYAVIRQEGSSKRILQQEFLTEEGANDWLKQYHLKKEKKQGYNPTKSAEHRRNLARMHDSRRIQTAMPPPSTQDMTRSQYANVKVPKPPPTWQEQYSPHVIKCYKDTKQALLSCTGRRGKAGWKREHYLCCHDLIGIDLLFKISCPCCCFILYLSALEKADLGWYRCKFIYIYIYTYLIFFSM